MTIQSLNPATGQPLREYALLENAELREAIRAAHKAMTKWKKTNFTRRAELMKAAARVLRDGAESFAKLMAEEMGKPVQQGRSE